MKKIIVSFMIVLFLAAGIKLVTSAFDGNDYDYGGDSGSYDSYDSYDSDDGGYSYGSGGSYIGGSSGDMYLLLIYAAVVVVVVIIRSGRSGRSTNRGRIHSRSKLSIQVPDRTEMIQMVIKGWDVNFSANKFISFAKTVYIDIQTAWCQRDMSTVRSLLHEDLYKSTVKQVQAKIDQGVLYHYESMVVNTAYLTSYAKDEQFEYLTIYLNARMIDWQEDEKTGKILRGDKTTRWDLRYKMKFMRSVGVVTEQAATEPKTYHCPNCGAPVELMSSAECPYCHSTVETGKHTWVLSDFETVRDDMVDEGIRV